LVAAAACGDDDGGDAGSDTTAAQETTTTAAGGEETTTTAAGGEETTTTAGGGDGGCAVDTSIDAEQGVGAGWMAAVLACTAEKPLKAEGDPIIIGIQNPQGDPAGSFPEYSALAEAAANYINEELGGIGADAVNGVPGRPIQVELCVMAINPADSQKCANELAGKDPFAVISTLNFFGNHYPIYEQAGINVLIGTPITIADFTGKSFAIGAGGGCLGVHTGLVWAITQEIGAKRVGVPWANTPPGVTCYYDLEAKPLDVLKGTVESTSELAGSIPDLEHIGVPVDPGTPDATPQAQQILDFNPDGIIFSAQGADCWTFVDALGRLGWTPDSIPLVLSGACTDIEKQKERGDLAKGIYFVGSPSSYLQPSNYEGLLKLEGETYQAKAVEYGASQEDTNKGFGTQGFAAMMTLYIETAVMNQNGEEVTPENFAAHMAATTNSHTFGSVPFGCANAPAPYVAACASNVALNQWDGEKLVPVNPLFNGTDLLAGTPIKPGPDS
jgi:branched-chain amino acid transport system substrate-binding protein